MNYAHSLSIHAEDHASRKTRGDTLVVVRIGRSGALRMSKPCEKCQKLLKKRGFSKVYFINWSGEVERMFL